MTRLIYISILILPVLSSLFLYITAYDTKNTSKDISQIKNEILIQKKEIMVLESELSLLAQPERIQGLSQDFGLNLEPIKISQMREIEDIPLKSSNKVLDELVERSLIGYSRSNKSE